MIFLFVFFIMLMTVESIIIQSPPTDSIVKSTELEILGMSQGNDEDLVEDGDRFFMEYTLNLEDADIVSKSDVEIEIFGMNLQDYTKSGFHICDSHVTHVEMTSKVLDRNNMKTSKWTTSWKRAEFLGTAFTQTESRIMQSKSDSRHSLTSC